MADPSHGRHIAKGERELKPKPPPVNAALAVKLYKETKSIVKTAKILGASPPNVRVALVAAGVRIIPKKQPMRDSKCCTCSKAVPQLCPFVRCSLDDAATVLASLGATAREMESKTKGADGTEHIALHYFVTACPRHEAGPLPDLAGMGT